MTDKLNKQLQLTNEMLLILIKSNKEIFNDVSEELLDYFTENVMKNTENKTFKEEYGGIFKDRVHCPNCGFAKYLIPTGFNPGGQRAYRVWWCKNCDTKFKEYKDNGEISLDLSDW